MPLDNIKNEIELINPKECSGCFSCLQKCPQNAIVSYENEEGFKYPLIDKNKCVNCGICLKVCPQLRKSPPKEEKYPKAFAMFNKKDDELIESSSGGVFSVLARYVLEKNGIIYGAAYDDKLKVMHMSVSQINELHKLRSSKYVQSDLKNVFLDVEQKLKEGKVVLFTGTPCQIAGLKAFLIKEYDKLYTCDLVCHGVPSPKLFEVYIEYLNKKFKSKVSAYNFRAKERSGWGLESKVTTVDGKIRFLDARLDPYYSNFLNGNIYRENCYNCKYANCNRESDITLADYWGIKKIHPEMYSKKGRSLVLINNKKGENLIEKVRDELEVISTNLKFAIKNNKNLEEATMRPKIRDDIYIGINSLEPTNFINKRLKVKYSFKTLIKACIPVKIKNKILKR